jgi:hypothetical protein
VVLGSDVFEDDRVVRVTQRVTSGGALQADDGGNVAGADFGYVFTLVGLQADDAANALFFAG